MRHEASDELIKRHAEEFAKIYGDIREVNGFPREVDRNFRRLQPAEIHAQIAKKLAQIEALQSRLENRAI